MMRAGVVVVSYNSADVLGSCLRACLRLGISEIIVVDNASTDGSQDIVRSHPGVRLIANTENRGFAGAVNQGFTALKTEVVLILNPDAEPLTDVAPLAEAAVGPGAGAAAGRLLDRSGATQHGFNIRCFPTAWTLAFEVLGLNRLWPGNPINRRYRQTAPLDRVTEVEQPAAAFLMVNRAAWEFVGGFDETFHPVWFEDVDFCKRLHDRGYSISYIPSVTARHLGGHSAANLPWATRQLFWYESLLRYSAKHFSPWRRRVVALAVMAASVGRAIHAVVVRVTLQPVAVYSRVFRLACSCLGVGGPLTSKELRRLSGNPE